jgi:hypothetical protein
LKNVFKKLVNEGETLKKYPQNMNEQYYFCFWGVWFMVFNATFNNISVLSWQSVLLMEKTGVPRENH